MKAQSRRASFIEAIVNIAVGASVAYVSQLVIFGWYGIHVSHSLNAIMTVWFTIISIARSYTLRRVFNIFTEKTLHGGR